VADKQQMMNAVLVRSAVDREFRQRLLDDPRSALKESFGLVLPDPFRIRFIERGTELDALVVLPDFKAGCEDGQLSEDDLESVNGGVTQAPWCSYDE
jgi:hypothetical protein